MGQTISGTPGDGSLWGEGGNTVLGGDGRDTLITRDVRGVAFDPADPTSGTVTFIDDSTLFFASLGDFLFEDRRDGIVGGTGGADAMGAGFVDARGDAIDGKDLAQGDEGHDTLQGEAGHDDLHGSTGVDMLFGGDDADVLRGDAGHEIDGGEGGHDHDTLILQHGATVAYEESQPENGVVTVLDGGTLTFRNIEKVVIPCFTSGTMIQTDRGEVAVEAIVAGDRVLTRDRGYQKICWVGRRRFTAQELNAAPHLVPVRIARGALGADMPARDMHVSPQHRLLAQGPRTKLLFGETEVLVPALHLVG